MFHLISNYVTWLLHLVIYYRADGISFPFSVFRLHDQKQPQELHDALTRDQPRAVCLPLLVGVWLFEVHLFEVVGSIFLLLIFYYLSGILRAVPLP